MKVELLDITEDAEKLIAESARTCYKSEAKGEGDNRRLVVKLCGMGHLSTFEHAKATFRISGISRACSHQLVRHRHFSFSQMSQRYVSEENFEYVTPPEVAANSEAKKIFREQMDSAREAYAKLVEAGAKKEDARFALPNAAETEIVVTAIAQVLLHLQEISLSSVRLVQRQPSLGQTQFSTQLSLSRWITLRQNLNQL